MYVYFVREISDENKNTFTNKNTWFFEHQFFGKMENPRKYLTWEKIDAQMNRNVKRLIWMKE